MINFIWIFVGGGLGSVFRYLAGLGATRLLGSAFPYGTLVVNVVGSFLISIAMYLSVEAGTIPPPGRLFLVTGFLGGFTTYSSFNYETLKLVQGGEWRLAASNILLTLLACTASGLLGLVVSSQLGDTRG